jgi:hypothetical protein
MLNISFKIIAIIFTGILSLNIFFVKAQQVFHGDSFEGRAVLGSHAIGGPGGALQDKLYGFDFTYQKNISHLTDNWLKLSNAKSAGVGLVFRDLQYLKGFQDTSANSFGQAYGLAAHMNFELLKSGNFSVNLRPAVGLSYLTKTFFTDKRNRFIGSHVNEIIKADLLFHVPLSNIVDFTAGAGFLHYSNGGYHIPNSGINMLSISTGLKFKNPNKEKEVHQTKYAQLSKNTFEVNFGIGRRGAFERREGLLKSGVYTGYNLFINDIFSLKGGFDAVYYYTVFNPAPGRDIETFQYLGTSYDRWRTGFSVGGETNLWRLALNAQVGKYVHFNNYYKDINWYWTTGLVYYVSPHVGLQAKTYFHRSQADFINFGLVFKM